MRYRYERWVTTPGGTYREGAHRIEGPYHRLPPDEWFGDVLRRGVPHYTPTEPQPARCGGSEA